MTLAAGTRLGPYEVLEPLGHGGMGEVYRGRDTRLNRDVAIKILPAGVPDNPTRRARFEREAQSISQLSHPNICAVYDVGEQDGTPFLVMEYIEGESLDQHLRRGAIPWTVALPWAIQIASAIDAAHRRGIVHRDLKPANVMIGESGVKLLDFGVAKLLEASEAAANQSTTSLTSEQKLVGTIHYMAPEQFEGRDVDARTDVFAFGATLYEMLTGRKPFDGASAASVTAAILTVNPPLVSSAVRSETLTPPGIDHVVGRALAKNPDERWQTARDLMLELRWILDGDGQTTLRPVGATRRVPLLVAAAVLLTAIGVLLGWSVRRSPEPAASVTVFTIAAPDGLQLPPEMGSFAVAPDGRKIVFRAGPPGALPSLWLRHLDSAAARLIPGTEGATSPFWSPDSESIGFYAEQATKLMRVRIDTGAPELITAVAPRTRLFSGAQFGAWAEDGTILFMQPAGVFRVNAAGGTPVLVAAPDDVRAETAPSSFTILPGHRFMGLVLRRSRNESELIIRALDGGQELRLPTIHSPALFAAGHLLFRRGESLVAQRFDAQQLELIGQPVHLAEGVSYNPGNQRTAFAAGGNLLAYRPEKPRKHVWMDRTGRPLGVIGAVGRDWNPVIAPDGSLRVAVDRYEPATDRYRIVTIDDRGRETTLTHNERQRFASFSPDGKWIAYMRIGATGSELRRTRVDGSGGDQLIAASPSSRTDDARIPLDWSSDGRYIICSLEGDLWALPLAEPSALLQLTRTAAFERTARLSRDGRWLAYTSVEGAETAVWVQDFPAGERKSKISADSVHGPSWRADGKELYYMTHDGSLIAVPVTAGSTFAHGTPVTLFKTNPGPIALSVHPYAATPDGQRFLVAETGGPPEAITVMLNWTALVK